MTRFFDQRCSDRDDGTDGVASVTGIDLYWLPLGAGGHSVRLNGKVFEAVAAWLGRRDRCDLYHSALQVYVPEGRFVIEQAPAWGDGSERGVVAEGAVGARAAGSFRLFRYEIRRWRDGVIPDIDEAVESPRRLSADPDCARRLLELVPQVPTPVWGRDELGTGEMWNSNSTISWLLARSGLDVETIQPPVGGRAPGWQAGIVDRAPPADSEEPAPGRGRVMMTRTLLKLGVVLGSITAAALLYRRLLRRLILNWGATDAEADARLPGDELLEHADGVATRAITIDAPASAVWPWIAQMGPRRAAAPTPTTGSRTCSDSTCTAPTACCPSTSTRRSATRSATARTACASNASSRERVLAIRSEDGNWVWSFVLDEQDGKTRLDQPQPLPAAHADRQDRDASDGAGIARHGAQDARGIKQRAERLAAEWKEEQVSERVRPHE